MIWKRMIKPECVRKKRIRLAEFRKLPKILYDDEQE